MKTKSVLSVDVSTRLGAHSVCEVAGLGKPSRILVVGRKEPRGELTSLAKVKLEERARPSTSLTLDEKKTIKESCWIVEKVDGDYFCDCRDGFKGHLCTHTICLRIRNNTVMVVVTDQVSSPPSPPPPSPPPHIVHLRFAPSLSER